MRDLKAELNTSIVLISHDMGVIAAMADRVQVMRNGEFVESGTADKIFYAPKHPYTQMLLDAMPRIDMPDRPGRTPLDPLSEKEQRTTLLEVEDVRVHFPIRVGGWIPKYKPLRAVDGVSFSLNEGETLGIVGESGCGKSTLARAVLALVPKTDGAVLWCGRNLNDSDQAALRMLRKELQIVFQDPLASLDPRMTIGQSISEPLRALEPNLERGQITERVREMMEHVGLDPAWINRYPHEFSGGQNQRVGIARAMIVRPKLVICDEAVSALFGMSMIFISHDLSVVRQVSHRVMVLYLGRVVEMADREAIYADPRHPYTRALIAAVPVPDPKKERAKQRIPLPDDLPSPLDTRAALTFLKSKRIDDPDAVQYVPQMIEVGPGHFVAEHDPV
jgi:oligopeptide/dipeptide ABC transporter ATP-binding protein